MTFRSIYFDCDSTLSAIEGIDELGRFASEDVQKELVMLTKLAMDGKLPLEEAYPKRLELLQPSEAQVGSLSESYIGALVPEVSEVIVALTHLGKDLAPRRDHRRLSYGAQVSVRIIGPKLVGGHVEYRVFKCTGHAHGSVCHGMIMPRFARIRREPGGRVDQELCTLLNQHADIFWKCEIVTNRQR